MLTIDGWRIDTSAREARRGNRITQLSPRAIRLLHALAQADGTVLSRAELLELVWPNVFVGDESLTQVVSELRRKLDNRALIATVAREGYRLTRPVLRDIEAAPAASPVCFSLDAYTLCIEARDCFQGGAEGSQRAFVDLSAEAAAQAPAFAEARALHATAMLKRHLFWSEGAELLEPALEETEAALELDATLAAAHLNRAAIFVAMGEPETGLRSLERALTLGSYDPGLHLEAAILALYLGRHRSAAALAVRASGLAPHDFGADLLASRIFHYRDPAQGRAHARRALQKVDAELSVNPHSMRALYASGPLLAQLGDHRAARIALESVRHHESPLEYYRAIGFAMTGDASSALERLDFLGRRGWRHADILDKDAGFRPLHADPRFDRLRSELLAA